MPLHIPPQNKAHNFCAFLTYCIIKSYQIISRLEDIVTLLGNIIWLVLAGWWLALAHLITTLLLAITVIGIPFAWAHLKLAGLALWPIGKIIVPLHSSPIAPA